MSASDVHQPISRERIDDIKRRHPIAEVAMRFTRLARAGAHLVGLCPLHAETVPSFYLFQQTQSWYCYGCQRGGDVIDLVRQRLDLTFDEALCWLDQRPQMATLPGETSAYRGVDRARARAARRSAAGQAALATALAVYTQALWETPAAQRYLARRGVLPEVSVRTHLGYCSGRQLLDALRRRGIPFPIAWDVGLLVGTRQSPRERFAGRIVIPEVRGGTIAWMTGRLIEEAGAPLLAGPRYMSLPGERMLGGTTALVGHTVALAVEGPFDWLTLVKWGLPSCYLGGGGFPQETVSLLSTLRAVYVAFDQDPAGERMAHALARQLPHRVRFVGLPAGIKDVAELGQHTDGLSRLRTCLREAARRRPLPTTS